MKKKFAGALALSFAMVLTFGMTALAAPSTTTSTSSATSTAASEAQQTAAEYVTGVVANKTVVIGGVEKEIDFKVEAVTKEVVTKAQEQAKILVAPNANVLKAFDVTLPAGDYSAGVQITFAVPGISAGQKIAVLHQKTDGTWESVPVNNVAQDSVTATFTSFSPVAIVAYEGSPKTGAAVSAAGVLALICLAGAGVSVTRIRNKK